MQSFNEPLNIDVGCAQNVKREPLRRLLSDAGQAFEFVDEFGDGFGVIEHKKKESGAGSQEPTLAVRALGFISALRNAKSCLPSAAIASSRWFASASEIYLKSLAISNWVSSSANDAWAIDKCWRYSLVDSRACPSAMLD